MTLPLGPGRRDSLARMAKFRIVIEGDDGDNPKTEKLAQELLQRTKDRFYQNGVIVQSTFARGGAGAPDELETERAKRKAAEQDAASARAEAAKKAPAAHKPAGQ